MDEPVPVSGPFPFQSAIRPGSWESYVRPFSEPGLSTCITEGKLRLDGVRVAATWIDVVAMRLVEWAVRKRQTLILISPDPYDLLVPLTAAAVHLGRMSELQKRVGGYPRSDAKVAIVTNRVRLRTAYRRLGLLNAKLFDAVPAATRLPTGEIAVLGRDAARLDWGTLFVDRPSSLRGVGGLSLIVVDLPVYDWEQLQDTSVPKILVGHDPSDRLVLRLEPTTPVFAWGADDLRGLSKVRVTEGAALANVAARLEQLAAGTSCIPVAVESQRVCESAAWFWSDIGLLHRAARESLLARELTSEAHELFQDLMHLAVPTDFYEEQTGRTFRARLRQLSHDEFQVRGDLRDLYLPTVHAELSDLVISIGQRSPKTDALLDILRAQVAKRRNVVVVARTAALARMYRAYLEGFADLYRVRVTSLTEVAEEPPAEVAVLTGLAPAWARYVYGSGIAADVRVLAYAPERQVVVADPFIETEYIRRTIAYQREYATWLARPALKARCWKTLSAEDLKIEDDHPNRPKVRAAVASEPEAPPDVPPGLWDATTGPVHQSQILPEQPAPAISPEDTFPVEGVRVNFEDGRWAILDRDGTITRYRSALQRAEPGTEVALLVEGDDVVFLDGDARKDVLAKVLEVAKDIPHLATAATWVEYWRTGLYRAKQKFLTYSALGDALRVRGCQRETQTIRLWVVGQTIGPSDPLDVRRVGEAIEDVALRDHHSNVYAGIEAFRDSHKNLMQRVGALALHVGPAASSGVIRADEVIDERSGLTAADFQNCVEILRIRSITPVGTVPFSAVGRLHES